MIFQYTRKITAREQSAQIYKLRMAGVSKEKISKRFDISIKYVDQLFYEHANRGRLPTPEPKPKKPNPVPLNAGEKWHKMHCGRGMTADSIARREGLDAETVRKVLKGYRERMWG